MTFKTSCYWQVSWNTLWLHKTWQPKKNNKIYNKDFFWTIRTFAPLFITIECKDMIFKKLFLNLKLTSDYASDFAYFAYKVWRGGGIYYHILDNILPFNFSSILMRSLRYIKHSARLKIIVFELFTLIT